MPTTWKLPATYTAREIVYAVQHAKAHPDDSYATPNGDVYAAHAYRNWFLARLHAKINRHRKPYGRKDDGDGYWSDWYRATYQLSRRVNSRGLIRASEVPPEFRRRLAHRLHTED